MKIAPLVAVVSAGALFASPALVSSAENEGFPHQRGGSIAREPPVTIFVTNPNPVTFTMAVMEVVTVTAESATQSMATLVPTVSFSSSETMLEPTSTASASTSKSGSIPKSCTTLSLPMSTTLDGTSTFFTSQVSTCFPATSKSSTTTTMPEPEESSAHSSLAMGAVLFVSALVLALL